MTYVKLFLRFSYGIYILLCISGLFHCEGQYRNGSVFLNCCSREGTLWLSCYTGVMCYKTMAITVMVGEKLFVVEPGKSLVLSSAPAV